MAQHAIDYTAIKAYADSIPRFDGNEFALYPFIEHSERLLNQFQRDDGHQLNSYLLGLVSSKLIGRALTLIGSRCDLTTWREIKSALISCFDDHRSIDCIVNDINMATPNPKESLLDFSHRLQTLRSKIATKLKSIPITEMPVVTKTVKYQHYEEMALNVFIRNLHPMSLQMAIRLRNPTDLEQAQSFLIQEENFQHLNNVKPGQKPAQQSRTPVYHPNFYKPVMPMQNFQQPRYFQPIMNTHQFNNVQTPNTSNNFARNNFISPVRQQMPINRPTPNITPVPSQRTPIQQRQNNTPTMRHPDVFHPSNSHKPAYTPTPMSTSSRLTNRPINYYNQNTHNMYTYEEMVENDSQNSVVPYYESEITSEAYDQSFDNCDSHDFNNQYCETDNHQSNDQINTNFDEPSNFHLPALEMKPK